ncbi:FeoA family protein [Peptostreptococcus faecalis]|uniref:FeoA family protein n=1 Tax=Peptostreptococcus faecalis TaxID=2045015 RepID=UPI000C7CD4D4|nr:FeoA family protein [Peptostreptococcus faecalis]
MNLLMSPIGVPVKIIKIRITGEQKKLLANMGFVESSSVIVVAQNAGNVIVNIKDSRVGIGEDIAKRIMVSPE